MYELANKEDDDLERRQQDRGRGAGLSERDLSERLSDVDLAGRLPDRQGHLPQPIRNEEGRSRQYILNQIRDKENIIVYRSPRSEWPQLVLLLFLLLLVDMLAFSFPKTLFPISFGNFRGVDIGIIIPLLLVFPLFVLGRIGWRLFDQRYVVGLESLVEVTGLASFNTRTTEVYYTNIRAVEIEQTFIQRLLHTGNLKIGALLSDQGDITMSGIRNPEQIKGILERRLRRLR